MMKYLLFSPTLMRFIVNKIKTDSIYVINASRDYDCKVCITKYICPSVSICNNPKAMCATKPLLNESEAYLEYIGRNNRCVASC